MLINFEVNEINGRSFEVDEEELQRLYENCSAYSPDIDPDTRDKIEDIINEFGFLYFTGYEKYNDYYEFKIEDAFYLSSENKLEQDKEHNSKVLQGMQKMAEQWQGVAKAIEKEARADFTEIKSLAKTALHALVASLAFFSCLSIFIFNLQIQTLHFGKENKSPVITQYIEIVQTAPSLSKLLKSYFFEN